MLLLIAGWWRRCSDLWHCCLTWTIIFRVPGRKTNPTMIRSMINWYWHVKHAGDWNRISLLLRQLSHREAIDSLAVRSLLLVKVLSLELKTNTPVCFRDWQVGSFEFEFEHIFRFKKYGLVCPSVCSSVWMPVLFNIRTDLNLGGWFSGSLGTGNTAEHFHCDFLPTCVFARV